VRRKVEKLARETGQTVERVVAASIDLYEQRVTKKDLKRESVSDLQSFLNKPKNKEIYSKIMRLLALQRSEALSSDERKSIASKAAKARSDRMTPEAKKARASKAAQARWNKKST
jgi:hypothetical protein